MYGGLGAQVKLRHALWHEFQRYFSDAAASVQRRVASAFSRSSVARETLVAPAISERSSIGKEGRMSDMSVYRAGGLSVREARRTSRELQRMNARGLIQAAAIDQQAELQAAKVEAVAYVGKRALSEVALLSQLECQLAQMIPTARGRLHALGDITALGMADVVSDTVRKVR